MATNYLSSLFDVSRKVVLITGGSRGIGLMVARGFVQSGASVIISSRNEQACIESAAALTKLGGAGSVSYVPADVSSRDGCERLADAVAKICPEGRLDVLVNNAGCAWGEPIARKSGKMNWGWDKVLDLNVKAPFYLSRACLPLLRRDGGKSFDVPSPFPSGQPRPPPSCIVNVGSVVGLLPQDAPTHAYDVSKAAVHHLTRKMSGDMAPYGVTVNALAPGFVPSKMSEGLNQYASFEEIASKTALGRLGNEDDMVGACIYFSSRAGSYCTGVILNVDGGTVGSTRIPLSSAEE